MSSSPSSLAVPAGAPLRSSGPLSSFAPMTAQPSTVPARRPRPLIMEWAIAGTATMSACLFSNPMEVVKTRMQVQNELAAHGQPQLYRNAFQAFWHVGRTEGIRGLQGGLAPSLLFQLTMNGTRLGLYEPMKRLVRTAAGGGPEGKLGAHTRKHDPPVFWHSMVAAGVSGAFAAFIGSPFFLVKVRLQIQSKQPQAAAAASVTRTAGAAAIPSAVGAQHAYTGMWSGLRSIYSEDGIRGLFRGASASIIRVTTGSVVQLSTYDRTKAAVMERTGWGESVKPVVNGRGTIYSSWLDCASRTLRTEGARGMYKGFVAHYLRVGPHTILTFVFWEKLKSLANKAGI